VASCRWVTSSRGPREHPSWQELDARRASNLLCARHSKAFPAENPHTNSSVTYVYCIDRQLRVVQCLGNGYLPTCPIHPVWA